jgi:lipopolysaccharide export system protein LptA
VPVTAGDAEREAAGISTPVAAAAPTAAAAAAIPAAPPTPALTASVPAEAVGAPAVATPAVAAPPAVAPAEVPPPVATAVSASSSKQARKKKAAAAGAEKTQVASNEPAGGSPFGMQFSSGHSPIDIKSDSLSLDYNGKSVLFTGHVRATQATGQLTSNELRVNYGKDFHDVTNMIATGNVRISQGTRWATGDHAVLDQTKHTVVLTGSPVVHDGPDEITGDRITVFLDSGRSVVDHARAVIFPKQSQASESSGASGASNP